MFLPSPPLLGADPQATQQQQGGQHAPSHQQQQERQQQQQQQQIRQQQAKLNRRAARGPPRGPPKGKGPVFPGPPGAADASNPKGWAPWGPCPVLLPPAACAAAGGALFIPGEGEAAATANASESLQVTVLGAGQDVGRSAVYVRHGERTMLFDCGSHLGAKQARKLPALNMLLQLAPFDQQGIGSQTMEEALMQPSPLFAGCTDATVVSHFHMDHCGSLPSFTERLGYRNPIAMTFPTHALSPVLLLDSARIFKEASFRGRQQLLQEDTGGREGASAGASQEQWNYTESEAQKCMRRCVALRLHEAWECAGWRTTPFYAGHVLGAAMMHSRLPEGFSIVYTAATTAAATAATAAGKVLIPVFAVGRAQELCMLLNAYWQRMQLQYPIYFGGGMTEKANKYYKLYVQWTGSDLAHRFNGTSSQQPAFAEDIQEDESAVADADGGAFSFSHISTLPPDVLSAPTPMVLLATPGMLHGGLALRALKLWADGAENLVLLPGYCVRGTIGAMLIDAHADTSGIQQLARHLQPQAVLLVHGEKEGMLKLARVLQRDLGVPVHTPPTGQTITVPLKPLERRIKVYVHSDCFRSLSPVGLPSPTTNQLSWDCDDPALECLLKSAAMQRWLPREGGASSVSSACSPYFVPAASLFFSISQADENTSSERAGGDSRHASVQAQGGGSEAVYLLIPFNRLLPEVSKVASKGCGSLAFRVGAGASTQQASAAVDQAAAEHVARVCEEKEDRGGAAANTAATTRHAIADRGCCAQRGFLRCLQLVALRYRQELTLPLQAFQQLLHLFMDYVVQCRQAYEQQRRSSGLSESALATPDFCDIGDRLDLRELPGGGIGLEFLSLIAVHDGKDRLSIQWADTDERRRGSVSVFVEYFSSVAHLVESRQVDAHSSVACIG
ncbi:hypothetical protein Emag_001960 [Eimeria magna]